MRFLCDEMLARLARLLRAAGYDAELASAGERDAALRERAKTEGRVLLTRDRHLAAAAAPGSVLVVADRAPDQARELSAVLPINWRLAPFTRCVVDNTLLRKATAQEIARMPGTTGKLAGPFRACPACGRLYWPGSHVQRMAARLAGLSDAQA
jgi:hypothetical protein